MYPHSKKLLVEGGWFYSAGLKSFNQDKGNNEDLKKDF